jgi:hypothetical protein
MKAKRKLIQIWLLCATMLPAMLHAQFAFTTNNGAITITRYTGTNNDVCIPSTTNGLPVTSIVSSGSGGILGGASSVTNITIPDSVTNIGFGALECYATAAGGSPDTFLSTITVDTNNSVYSSVDGVLFDKIQSTLIQYPCGKTDSNYTISTSVANIADNAFYNCINLASVTISDNVTNVGNNAFAMCYALTNAAIGNGVTSIGDGAFNSCYWLTSLTIGTNVASIGIYAFSFCYYLTSVTIPDSVTTIGYDAFQRCLLLTNVIIGSSVTNIGSGAFFVDRKLTSVYFRGNAPSLGVVVFALETPTVYYLPGTTGWLAFSANTGIPTALWLPQAQPSDATFGVQTNQFGFNINWASGQTVVVEACTDMANPVWTPVATNTLTDGSSHFSDSQWTNYPGRFYRLRSP